ncbi:MAG: hypothetical protein WC444_07015 [Candidatus Paceibacterota bacterium]
MTTLILEAQRKEILSRGGLLQSVFGDMSPEEALTRLQQPQEPRPIILRRRFSDPLFARKLLVMKDNVRHKFRLQRKIKDVDKEYKALPYYGRQIEVIEVHR